MTESIYRSAEELLPPESLDVLSKEAVSLYVWLRNLMARKALVIIWVSDHVASIGARVNFDNIARAKCELVEAGLVAIRPGKWPADDVPNICHQYRCLVSDTMTSSIAETLTCVSR